MNPDELSLCLTSMSAAHEVARAIREPTLQAARGWNLTRWQVEDTPVAVRFLHLDRQGKPDTAVLCADAPESCRWAYEAAIRLAPVPTTLLMLARSDEPALPKETCNSTYQPEAPALSVTQQLLR